MVRRRPSCLSSSPAQPRVGAWLAAGAFLLSALLFPVLVATLLGPRLPSVAAASLRSRVLAQWFRPATHHRLHSPWLRRRIQHARQPALSAAAGTARACLPACPELSESLPSPCPSG